jgi:hypothetical protein
MEACLYVFAKAFTWCVLKGDFLKAITWREGSEVVSIK